MIVCTVIEAADMMKTNTGRVRQLIRAGKLQIDESCRDLRIKVASIWRYLGQ